MIRLIIIGFLTLWILSGCAPKSQVPMTTYGLKTKALCSSAPKSEIKVFVDTHNDEYFATRLIYTNGLKKEKYLFTAWSGSPVQMFQSQLVNNMNDCGFKASYYDMQSTTAQTLRVVMQGFEQNFDGNASYGYVRMQAWLYGANGSEIASRVFIKNVKAPTNDGVGGIEAINTASGQVISEMLAWLSKDGK